MANLKVRDFNGVTRIAPANIEANSTTQALRNAQYEFDVMMHDLRSEFIQREGKLRQEYLDRVGEITSAE
jgi:hypothetical protein